MNSIEHYVTENTFKQSLIHSAEEYSLHRTSQSFDLFQGKEQQRKSVSIFIQKP